MSTLANPDPAMYPWYAVRTRSRHEKVVAAGFQHRDYVHYLPSYRSRRQWTDRIVEIDAPLFPGYVFCRFDARRRLDVLTTPGVVSIVGFGKEPMPVEEKEVLAVRSILGSGLAAEPHPFLRVGQRIKVVRGSLSGLEGLLVKKKTQCRLVVSVTLLQRALSVEIDSAWITGV